jgi:hypothetical protein
MVVNRYAILENLQEGNSPHYHNINKKSKIKKPKTKAQSATKSRDNRR